MPLPLNTTKPSFGTLQEDAHVQDIGHGVTSLQDDGMATIKARDKRQGRRSLHQLRRHSAPTPPQAQLDAPWSAPQVARPNPSPFALAFVSRPQPRYSSPLPPPPGSPFPRLASQPFPTCPSHSKQPQTPATSNHTPSPGTPIPRARDQTDAHNVPETPAPLAPPSAACPAGSQTLEATPASLDGNSISSVPSSMSLDSIPSCSHSKDLSGNRTHNGDCKIQINDNFSPSLHARMVQSTTQPAEDHRHTTVPTFGVKLGSPGQHSQGNLFSGSESDEGYATPLEFRDSSYISDSRWATVATFEHPPSPLMVNGPLHTQRNARDQATRSPLSANNNINNPFSRPLLYHHPNEVQSQPPASIASPASPSPYHRYSATDDNDLWGSHIRPRHRRLRSTFNNDIGLGGSDADYVRTVPRWAPWVLLLAMLVYWYWVVVGVLRFMVVFS